MDELEKAIRGFLEIFPISQNKWYEMRINLVLDENNNLCITYPMLIDHSKDKVESA